MNRHLDSRSKGAVLLGLLCIASMTVNAETRFEVTGKGFIDVAPDEATFSGYSDGSDRKRKRRAKCRE
jgi:hypothetical protein